jgi:hypothetical protein
MIMIMFDACCQNLAERIQHGRLGDVINLSKSLATKVRKET